MTFVNFQRHVCDQCGKQATQVEAVDWFELGRREKLSTPGYQMHTADACSVECLGRLATVSLRSFISAKKRAQNG